MRNVAFVAALLALFTPALQAGDVYPGFRGDGSGRSDAKNLPTEWSPKSVAWQIKLPGYGQSAPVVYKDRIFITAIDGPNKEKNLVAAYDAVTGKQLWLKELPATQKVKASFSVSRAAPTPLVDADALYVFFESGELAAFDHAGKQLWLRSLVKDYGEFKNNHGLGGSPAQTKDAVIVLADHQGPSYLLAVNKSDGKNRWKVERKSRVSWTSPVVVRRGDKDMIVISSGGSVDVYETGEGKQLSSYTDVGNNNVPSAVVLGDRVVVGASDPPQKADRELTLKSCCCLTLDAEGKLSDKAVWTSEKATASFASPLIHKDCAYYLNGVGVLGCLDLKTGKEHYSERIGRACWAAPVGVGDHVYLFGKDGVTTIVKAGPKFEKVAVNPLWEVKADAAKENETKEKKGDEAAQKGQKEGDKKGKGGPPPAAFLDPIVYGAAVVDGAIYIRTGTMLYGCGRRSE